MKRFLTLMLAIAMLLSCATFVVAADDAVLISTEGASANARYVTPEGAGKKDGTTWENAFAGDKKDGLKEAWDATPDGGTLYVGAGEYKVAQTLLMETGNKTLQGVSDDKGNKPSFTGDYDKMSTVDKGTNFIELAEKVTNITVDNFKVNNYSYVVYTYGGNEVLRFSNLDMNYICDGFYLDGHSTEEVTLGNRDIIIRDCTAYWHRKRVVRFKRGNADCLVINVKGDACGEEAWRTGNWPVGIAYESNAKGVWEERITAIDCTFENCFQATTFEDGSFDHSKYWNSDGFSGERTTRDLTFIRCHANSTTDGGWDMKTVNLTLIDCTAMNNKRNLRFWSEGQATLINCLSAYSKNQGGSSGSTGMWTSGYVEAYNSTFFNNNGSQMSADGGYITLHDCIVGYFGKESKTGIGSGVMTDNVAVFEGTDPQFNNMSEELFYGDNTNWNSKLYPNGEVGYFYDAENQTVAPDTVEKAGGPLDIVNTTNYDWAKEAVDFVIKNDFMTGYSQQYFGAAKDTKRVDFAMMLSRALNMDKNNKATVFEDLPKAYRYRGELGILVDNEILKGEIVVDETTNTEVRYMRPWDGVTRQEMMCLVARALRYVGAIEADYKADLSVLDQFTDKDLIADWAKQDVANIVAKGIIIGDNGIINPLGNVTRAETAVIAQRIAPNAFPATPAPTEVPAA